MKIPKYREAIMETFTTMITPYLSDGSIDFETVKRYVDFYFENQLTGIFAVCQSSEIFYLSLEERIALNKTVYTRAKELERESGRRFTVVSSGHVSDSPEDQARELNAIWESGTDALILITNRLDPNNEGDDVFIRNAEALIAKLPPEAKLGLYECPHPYKRLVTPKILNWCISTGRFYYMKDTCCDVATMAERCRITEGTPFQLLNANCQTLLESYQNGARGYCGIMCNYHPRLYAALAEEFEKGSPLAQVIQDFIGNIGFTEVGLPYPLSAKYHMGLCGMPSADLARNRVGESLSTYAKSCLEQMKRASDHFVETHFIH